MQKTKDCDNVGLDEDSWYSSTRQRSQWYQDPKYQHYWNHYHSVRDWFKRHHVTTQEMHHGDEHKHWLPWIEQNLTMLTSYWHYYMWLYSYYNSHSHSVRPQYQPLDVSDMQHKMKTLHVSNERKRKGKQTKQKKQKRKRNKLDQSGKQLQI